MRAEERGVVLLRLFIGGFGLRTGNLLQRSTREFHGERPQWRPPRQGYDPAFAYGQIDGQRWSTKPPRISTWLWAGSQG